MDAEGPEGKAVSPATKWKLEGDYVEGCECEVVCPCVYFGSPSRGDCHVLMAWHVTRGQFGSVKLDGLNVSAMFHAPGHMTTGPKMEAGFYVDSRAKPEQAAALETILSGRAGGPFEMIARFVGEVKGVRSARIEIRKGPRSRTVHIPDVLDLEIEAMKGGDGKGVTTLHNAPFGGDPRFDSVVSKSKTYRYQDHGYRVDFTGKNGFYTRFSYRS